MLMLSKHAALGLRSASQTTSSSVWTALSIQRLSIVIKITNNVQQSTHIFNNCAEKDALPRFCAIDTASQWHQGLLTGGNDLAHQEPWSSSSPWSGHSYLFSVVDESTFAALLSISGSRMVKLNYVCVFMVNY